MTTNLYCKHIECAGYVVEYVEITKDTYRNHLDWLDINHIIAAPCDVRKTVVLSLDDQGDIEMGNGDIIAVVKKKAVSGNFDSETLATEVRCCSPLGWQLLQQRLKDGTETFANEEMYHGSTAST